MWIQRTIRLPARPRGFHLVTTEVLDGLPELRKLSVGMLQLLIQHTSASLALSENASPEVRRDRPALGTWQGIYLCEHRDSGGSRSLVATAWGKPEDGG
jgi:thiamine phosphate synthase YjbQ (UPF0047 family)